MKKRTFCAAALATLATLLMGSQKALAQDNNVSLEDTLKYIKNRIDKSSGHQAPSGEYTVGETNEVTRIESCTITTKHGSLDNKDKIDFYATYIFSLSTLDPSLTKVVQAGYRTRYGESIFFVFLQTSDSKETIRRQQSGYSDVSYSDVFRISFVDKEIADRVAKAFNHAIKLCGGREDPFKE